MAKGREKQKKIKTTGDLAVLTFITAIDHHFQPAGSLHTAVYYASLIFYFVIVALKHRITAFNIDSLIQIYCYEEI